MPAPHNIGLVSRDWTPDVGPTATLGEAFARTLLAAGLRPFVLAAEHDPRRPTYAVRDERIGGVRVRRVNLPAAGPTTARELEADPRVEAVARAWIADRQLDLVHAFDTGPFGLGALDAAGHAGAVSVASLLDHAALCPRRRMVDVAGRACDTPSSESCAACLGETYLRVRPTVAEAGSRTSRALARLRGVDLLLAPSQATIERFVHVGMARARLVLCPSGVEKQTLALATELARRDLPHGRRLGVLGATRPSSGVLELAHAVCLVDRPGLTLEVHGPTVDSNGDATYLNALRRLADLDPRVRLHGAYELKELPRVLATLDAVAAPDRWEVTTATAVREARAASLPVLASARGVHRELADDPGLQLVEGDGLDPWVAALRTLEFAPTRPAPMRSLLSMAEQVLELYRSAARCGPVLTTPSRSSSQPLELSTSDAPRPFSS